MKTTMKFGKIKNYKKGDVVVWKGQQPCIGSIRDKANQTLSFNKNAFVIDESHNSLHYSNLRKASDKEIKMLGSENKYILPDNYFDSENNLQTPQP